MPSSPSSSSIMVEAPSPHHLHATLQKMFTSFLITITTTTTTTTIVIITITTNSHVITLEAGMKATMQRGPGSSTIM